MKIYLPGGTLKSRTVYVQPGKERDDNSEWFARDARGFATRGLDGKKEAILFPVKFVNGEAEVDSALGRYMIDKQLASDTPIEIVSRLTAAAVEEPKRTLRMYR